MKHTFLYFITFCISICLIQAKPIQISISEIKPVQTSEVVDEVYVSIIARPSFAKPFMLERPEFPNYWSSKLINKLEDEVIFTHDIPKGESIAINIAFINRDMPPLNPDDLLGSITIKIINTEGVITYQYQDPISGSLKESLFLPTNAFKLKTSNSLYLVNLAGD